MHGCSLSFVSVQGRLRHLQGTALPVVYGHGSNHLGQPFLVMQLLQDLEAAPRMGEPAVHCHHAALVFAVLRVVSKCRDSKFIVTVDSCDQPIIFFFLLSFVCIIKDFGFCDFVPKEMNMKKITITIWYICYMPSCCSSAVQVQLSWGAVSCA